MKVGFCLDDSEGQHVEPAVGPKEAVYSDATGRKFCRQFEPEALTLFEGISAGWRDLYSSGLAFQWVDASNVLPGEYWLREDVNPIGIIKEGSTAQHTPGYANSPTIIPGFDAQSQSLSTHSGEPRAITLTSQHWKDSSTPKYKIVTPPAHGKLGMLSGSSVTYTPEPGFAGGDSFTFSAADASSPFPRNPAVATVSIQVEEPTQAPGTLLVGDPTATYSTPDQTAQGREESFQFPAQASGTVEQLAFLTGPAVNTGIESVVLALFADNGGTPGAPLGSAVYSGSPPSSTWIKVTGLAVPVVANTKYWLVVLPVGRPGSQLNFNAGSIKGAGSPNLESAASELTIATPESSWESYEQGPAGFQASGSPAPPPTLAVNGAQQEMIAGTSVTLTASVTGDNGGVTWEQSSGTLTPENLKAVYVAPSSPGTVTVTARLADNPSVSSQVTIKVAAAPPPAPAPSVPVAAGASESAAFQLVSPKPGLLRPRAMLIGNELIMTTEASVAGRVRLTAYQGRHRLGSCVNVTPGSLTFTCRLALSRTTLHGRIAIVASLRVGSLLLSSALPAKRIPEMKMKPFGQLAHAAVAGVKYWCSPETLVPTIEEGN
jgi:hypothetical protein